MPNREFEYKLVFSVIRRTASPLFFPKPLRAVIVFFRSLKYIGKGIKALLGGNLSNYISALSEADAGIAINTGAAIAKEIADITVSSEDFFSLLS